MSAVYEGKTVTNSLMERWIFIAKLHVAVDFLQSCELLTESQ